MHAIGADLTLIPISEAAIIKLIAGTPLFEYASARYSRRRSPASSAIPPGAQLRECPGRMCREPILTLEAHFGLRSPSGGV
jgi:hypothetical protein